ncbi:PREDICTED: something about silencing protein 10 [Nanorana parkeri]|uniref:something about silencing protein 10 n=1 Tax=Nanorana parkeri TaxID=125878 RepID=UPI00085446EB|nr:PREDICTED: something about silencing protein 10 [Nanorana parkeri]
MGKARRTLRPKKAKEDNLVYDESLSKADIPSTTELSSEYYNDEIDDYHEKKFKSLMEKGVKFDSDEEQYDSEDEVMPLDIPDEVEDDDEAEDEDDQISMGSDLEDREKDGLPDALAWGQKKKLYYDTDYKDYSKKKEKKTKEELEAEAEEEEEEAQNIQKRLVNTLSEEDYGLEFLEEFSEKQSDEKLSEGKIVKDLEKMSDKEKRKLLKKESPELLELIQDLKLKLAEVKNELEPLLQMVKDGTIPEGKGSAYLQTKFQLYMNYCPNISYYLFLKAKRLPITGHPVIERLVTYRNLINKLGAVDERLSPEVHLLLSEEFQKNPGALKPQNGQPKASKKAAVKRPLEQPQDSDADMDEEDALNYYKMMENKLREKRKRGEKETVDEEPTEETDPNAKRAITYQIAKNKGLTPKRKKIDRNPRVKHREKFRRAKIRRKGQVREVRKEEVRYSGELSGIRAGVKKSIKLK